MNWKKKKKRPHQFNSQVTTLPSEQSWELAETTRNSFRKEVIF